MGDGDAGETLKNGAKGVLGKLDANKLSSTDVASALLEIAATTEIDMGGTSGGL